jgi:dTDP-glucose pyrophosphorylase
MIKKIKNFNKYTVTISLNAIDAIKQLNKSDNRFLLVVNKNKKVVGSITDGDVRRWLISGGNTKDTASKIMNGSPLIGKKGDEDNNLYKLRKIPLNYFKFLPILDNSEKLYEILISDEQIINNSFTALIMAGGFGKRLGKITKNTPKPMLKVGNKSILEMTLEKLENDGFNNIYISVHHMADQIEQFIKIRNNKANIEILYENKPLGTIGALSLMPENISWPLLVINSDLITDLKFKSIIAFHKDNKNDMSIVSSTYENQIPFGIIESNAKGLINKVKEKPIYSYPILAGVYCINKNIKKFVKYYKPKDITDLINDVIKNKKRVQIFPMYEYWRDIGRPTDLKEVKNNIDIEEISYKFLSK